MARLLRFTVVRGNYGKHSKGESFDLLEDSEAARAAKEAVETGRLRFKPVAGHVPRAPRNPGEVPHGGIARHVVAIFAGLEGTLRGAVDAASKLSRDEQEQLAQLLRDNRPTLDGLLAALPLMDPADVALALPGAAPALDPEPEPSEAAAAPPAPATAPAREPTPPPAPALSPVAAPPEAAAEEARARASNPLPKPVDEMSQAEAIEALKAALAAPTDYTTSVLILLGRKAGLPMPGLSGKKKDVVVGALRDLLLGEEEDGNPGDEAAAAPPRPSAPPEQPSTPPAAPSGDAP